MDLPRLLSIDHDAVLRELIVMAFPDHEVQGADNWESGLSRLATELPIAVVIDMQLPGPPGAQRVRQLRASTRTKELTIICIRRAVDPDACRTALDAGADAVLDRQLTAKELRRGVESQIQARASSRPTPAHRDDLFLAHRLTHSLANEIDTHKIIATLCSGLATLSQVDRCCVILTDPTAPNSGSVVSNDDDRVRRLNLDAARYPELDSALRSTEAIGISQAASHPLTSAIHSNPPETVYDYLTLVPVTIGRRAWGVICLQSSESHCNKDTLALVQIVGTASAVSLKNASTPSSPDLKPGTAAGQHSFRVPNSLYQRSADFLDSAADGVVVLTLDGTLLFSNPKAREIVGFGDSSGASTDLLNLLSASELKRATELVRGFSEGIYPQGFELEIRGPSGIIALNINTSSVLKDDNAVLLSFREVTAQRQTEAELKQTKEFLERVIESSVDGIVSANLEGRVLLFNEAAGALFGRRPADVINRVHIQELYGPGVAKKVMRLIRDPNVTGRDRLSDYRVAALGPNGEEIPVMLSASLIYKDRQEMGSVGIYTDIRPRLGMEARLSHAELELREQEKGAAIAQLAGATSHELNQPLTSVLGYAEYLSKYLGDEPKLRKAAEVILSEAERMTEIVRKLGKITKYETKTYIGGSQIVDIDRAAESSPRGKK